MIVWIKAIEDAAVSINHITSTCMYGYAET